MIETICAADEGHGSACEGLPLYGEHGGKPYCVLHFPGGAKEVEFGRTLESKLAKHDYDFGGAVFPRGTANFENRRFEAHAVFAEATFQGGSTSAGPPS